VKIHKLVILAVLGTIQIKLLALHAQMAVLNAIEQNVRLALILDTITHLGPANHAHQVALYVLQVFASLVCKDIITTVRIKSAKNALKAANLALIHITVHLAYPTTI
jgi:hypothetical protein